MMKILKAVFAQVALGLAETTCLPNAIPASDRRELVSLLAGESKFFGQLQPTQSAAQEFSLQKIPKDILVPLFFKRSTQQGSLFTPQ